MNVLLHFVCSSIWNNALVKEQPIYVPTNWGWKLCDGKFVPLWMTQREASKECRELVKCSCKKLCSGRCRCKRAELPCTELCKCGGGCD